MSRTPKLEAGAFSKTIGRRIRWIRQIQGRTLEEMESQANLGGKTMARYETGGISIPADAIEAMASALNVSPNRLCGPLADFAWLAQEQIGIIEAPRKHTRAETL